MCVHVCVCVQTLRQHLQQESMKKAILGTGLDLQTAVGLMSGGIVPPTTPEIIQEAFKNVSMCCMVGVRVVHACCTLIVQDTASLGSVFCAHSVRSGFSWVL